MSDVVVRSFVASDQKKVHDLYKSGQDAYMAFPIAGPCYRWFVMDKLKEDGDVSNIEKVFMSDPTKGGFWVAEIDGAIVGIVGATVTSRFDESHTELVRMFVSPDVRKQAVGSKLVAALEAWAVQAGYKHIYLSTLTDFPGPNHLYPKCGFTLVESEAYDVTERLGADTYTAVGVNHYVKHIA